MEQRKRHKWMPRLMIATAVVVAIAVIVFAVKGLLADAGAKKRKTVHQIALLKPPPPPPPPKPEVKPPPEIKKEQVKIEQPKPQEQPQQSKEPPPGENLKLDTAGTGQSDAFGLQAGQGRDLTAIAPATIGGTGAISSGSARAQYAFYINVIKRHFDEELAKNRKLRSGDYRVVINVWLARDGRIQRYELAGSSGSPDTDELLKTALSGMLPLPEPPPEAMPQPVRLRITARGTT